MYVGSVSRRFEGLHDGYSLSKVDVEDKFFLDFLVAFDLTIASMLFRKIYGHFMTQNSGMTCPQIYFISYSEFIKKKLFEL